MRVWSLGENLSRTDKAKEMPYIVKPLSYFSFRGMRTWLLIRPKSSTRLGSKRNQRKPFFNMMHLLEEIYRTVYQ